MGLETFPEIESFQKLPHQVIVKGGNPTFSAKDGAELRGIIINNIGHTICDIKVNLVIFNEKKIPMLNTSMMPDPATLPQGAITPFVFHLKEWDQPISDYHLYTNWKFDDRSE